jgi:hypothetical protein
MMRGFIDVAVAFAIAALMFVIFGFLLALSWVHLGLFGRVCGP